mgnify:CR=1 FL=1
MPEWLLAFPTGLARSGAYGTVIGAGGGFILLPLLLLFYPHENLSEPIRERFGSPGDPLQCPIGDPSPIAAQPSVDYGFRHAARGGDHSRRHPGRAPSHLPHPAAPLRPLPVGVLLTSGTSAFLMVRPIMGTGEGEAPNYRARAAALGSGSGGQRRAGVPSHTSPRSGAGLSVVIRVPPEAPRRRTGGFIHVPVNMVNR